MNDIPKYSSLDKEQKSYFSDLFDESLSKSAHSITEELGNISERYVPLKKLASGGMKDIFTCQDKTTGRLIAKAILQDSQNEKAIEDFLREARITAYLQHPNIMPIYDMGQEEDKAPFFTMKLIEGQTLTQFVKQNSSREKLSANLGIFLKICDAIAYAHSKSILHLDIKPDNIQVSSFGNVLVCDWGIAKIISTKVADQELEAFMLNENLGEQATLNGYIKGTPGYLAPEQVSKDYGSKDERTDIYALGALLYFILTGKSLAHGKGITEKLKNATTGLFPVPSQLETVPTSLESICLKALEIKKAERYQTVSELKRDLQSYLDGFAPAVENARLIKQCQLFYKRNQRVTIASLVSVVLIIIITVLYTSVLQKVNAEKTLMNQRMHNHIITIAKRDYSKSRINNMINMLEGLKTPEALELRRIAYFISHQFNKVETLFHNQDSSPLRKVNKHFIDLKQNEKLNFNELIIFLRNGDIPRDIKSHFFKYHLKYIANLSEKLRLIPIITEYFQRIDQVNLHDTNNQQGLIIDLSNNLQLASTTWVSSLHEMVELDIANTSINSLKVFRSGYNIRRLNVEKTPLSSLAGIENLKLTELNIAKTRIGRLDHLKDMHSLKKLTISKNFPKVKLKAVPKTTKIIYK